MLLGLARTACTLELGCAGSAPIRAAWLRDLLGSLADDSGRREQVAGSWRWKRRCDEDGAARGVYCRDPRRESLPTTDDKWGPSVALVNLVRAVKVGS